jgi:Holliday junction DNA helicase RuvB
MILDLFRKHIEFYNIHGYDDIKDVVRRALDAEDNYNLLFIGPPASAKTLFLLGILDIRKNGVYFDGSNTTNRILDVLEQERPKIICIDELDKMPRTFQNQLLNFMESGRVKVDQQKKQYDFEIKGAKVFATFFCL